MKRITTLNTKRKSPAEVDWGKAVELLEISSAWATELELELLEFHGLASEDFVQIPTEIENYKTILFVLFKDLKKDCLWANQHWKDLRLVEFDSVNDASKTLKSISMIWASLSTSHHRRRELIDQSVRSISIKKQIFPPQQKFNKPIPHFLLANANQLVYSQSLSHVLQHGIVDFIEDKKSSPSRAYLKLWEAFMFESPLPKPIETVLDLGACPGGWSWVLSHFAKEVLAVDTAPLDQKLKLISNITWLAKDAFKIKPEHLPQLPQHVYCDIICEPERCLELIQTYLEVKEIKSFVFTMKFKGPTRYEPITSLLNMGLGKLSHLNNNKHELTWQYSRLD